MVFRTVVVVISMLISTTAHAQVEDTGEPADVAPGPKLPNGEPAPKPDLQEDAGGISCAMAKPLAAPVPFILVALALLRRRR